jgi:hypothetical protein
MPSEPIKFSATILKIALLLPMMAAQIATGWPGHRLSEAVGGSQSSLFSCADQAVPNARRSR